METFWYAVVVVMLGVYVVLDGFDFGVGILHLLVAKTDAERRQVFNSIGPFWNGNEVWLLAGGGLLVFAFPGVYAAGFSGFYLPLMMVLWLLVLRGLSIELRSKEENKLWRDFWDTVFSASSLIMAIVLGAALGNVIRGVPLDASGYFDGALFTNFLPGPNPGILDWYTVSVGVFAALMLAGHGALFLQWKTSGAVHERSRSISNILWIANTVVGILVTLLTNVVRPELYQALVNRPWTFFFPVVILLSVSFLVLFARGKNEFLPLCASSILILSLLAATAAGLYPNMLISTVDPQFSLTAQNAAVGSRVLQQGVSWWVPALLIAIFYFVNLYRTFSGKVLKDEDLYGH